MPLHVKTVVQLPVDVEVGDVVLCKYDNNSHAVYVVTIIKVTPEYIEGPYHVIHKDMTTSERVEAIGRWCWDSLEFCSIHQKAKR